VSAEHEYYVYEIINPTSPFECLSLDVCYAVHEPLLKGFEVFGGGRERQLWSASLRAEFCLSPSVCSLFIADLKSRVELVDVTCTFRITSSSSGTDGAV